MSTHPVPVRREGIVVGRQDLGETDRILRLLTPDAGRVSVVARGARGPRSKWTELDLGTRAAFQLRPGRGDLDVLVSADVADARVQVRSVLENLTLACHACEVIGSLARTSQAEPRMYGLLEMALTLLDAMDGPTEASFRAGLETKALSFAGFAPVLVACVVCGGAPEPGMHLLVASASARHARCAHPDEGPSLPVTAAFCAAVEHARRSPLRDVVDTPLPPGPRDAISRAIEHHLGHALHARALLDTVNGGAA